MADRPRLTRRTDAPQSGIVHFGPGAFFRAFIATYTDDALETQPDDWGIVAISLRSTDARDALQAQRCAYTAVELGPTGRTPQVVNALSDVLVAPEDPAAVVDIMCDPAIKIVSLTVTEKGYCHNPSTGGLDLRHPDIVHDLANADLPRSVLGFLVSALDKRKAAGINGLTVMSCDNLPSNGKLLRSLVLDFARRRDPKLADWIDHNTSFPCSMVDRITPATTEDDVTNLAELAGYFDPACVVHEPFRQWVIEDKFVAGRPAWELVGAQLVGDVQPHELMKLRCLNGTHSALAYLGYLAGYDTIAETTADPDFAQLCQRMWAEEIVPTLPRPEGEDLTAYCTTLLRRYQNPAIHHRTWQIAMDGSQKLPQRLLATILDNLKTTSVPAGLCLAIAAWMRYVGAIDENGRQIDVRDPMAARLRSITADTENSHDRVAAYLAVEEVFDPELANNDDFRGALTHAYVELSRIGARAAVRNYAS